MGVSNEQRIKFGFTEGIIRMNVGIVNIADISCRTWTRL
jgi:O-acetylhomoserine/O-acetylserine sulfhydrylase-like pyridoxal-dependent enzyme